MDDVYIEKAVFSDAKHILDIQKEAYLSEAKIYDDYQIAPLTQSLIDIESDFKTHRFHVARVKGKIVACINIKVEGNRGLIGRLAVKPEMQNQGIGTLLMDYIESHYESLTAFELFTGHKSERNLNFYSRRGYKAFKQQTVNKKLTFIFMRKIQ